jgi:CRISPR/Cas system-associated endonuclease/helicase Cas3
VFDELHLLDPDRSFATTLKLLEQVQGISPYLLMTATLTHELAVQIQQEVTPRGALAKDRGFNKTGEKKESD